MTNSTIDRIPMHYPTVLAPLSLTAADTPPRSWIQLAKTGKFKSKRYGEFSITRDDLKTMLHNFKHVTPLAPTELPVDFDHLSMEAAKPGDGIAAGWFKNLELRGSGDELWGEVEWTTDAATKIRNKEYRYVSPSFVKNHEHKDGTKIGTTLLAAAITNHPFLEGMAALTLCADDLAVAVSTAPDQQPTKSEDTMQDLQTKAERFEARVTQLSKGTKSWAHAFHLAQQEDEAGAMAYRLAGISAKAVEDAAIPAFNLSVRSGESFDQVAQRYAAEKGVSLRQAIHDVGRARPDLASARG